MKRILMMAAAMAAASPLVSWACGACDEDKVAATYDHAIVDRAHARHDQVVFVAIDGTASAAKVSRRVTIAAPTVRGVVPGSLRTSLSPAAFSFALDRTQSPEKAVSDFRKTAGAGNTRLTVVRVMRDDALIAPN